MLPWALTAAALLLFAYAVRTLFVSSREGGDEKQQKLGCGFAVVAAVLWVWALNYHLDNAWGAIRIGVGVLLLLPAVQALAKPQGARILRAAVGLILAVLIAGPVLQALWTEYGIDTRPEDVRELADHVQELEELRVTFAERGDALEELHDEVAGEIRASGKGWEELQDDPALLERLEVLRRIEEERAKVETALAGIDARLPELREALRLAEAAGTAPEPGPDSELERLRLEFEAAPPLDELSLVEEHVRKQELRALFEEEF